MNAVALPILAGPTAVPIPSSEGSLLGGTSFGTLVAAAAKGEGVPAEEAGDTAVEVSAAEPEVTSDFVPAFVVRQCFAQTDSPPSLSKGLISVLERFNSGTPNGAGSESLSAPASEPEEPLPTDDYNMLGPEFAAPAPPPASEKDIDGNAHPANEPKRVDFPVPNHDRSTRHHVVPGEGPGLAMLAPSADPQSIQPQNIDSSIGRTALNSQARNSDGVLPDGSAPASLTRADSSAIARPAHAAPFGERLENSETPTGDSTKRSDEVRAAAWDQPKTHAADNPKPSELPSKPHVSARPPESFPQIAVNTQVNSPANASAQTPDSTIPAPVAANPTATADTSADAPVKLALAVRAGQQAPDVQTLALHIAARSARGDSRFTIRLDPPELGRIDVSLIMSSHGHAQAVLAVEKPQTLDLLLRDAPALERALKDTGLELGGNLSFSLKEEGRPHFARDEHDTRPSHTVQLSPAEAMNTRSPLNSSIVEHLYSLRMARLDITV